MRFTAEIKDLLPAIKAAGRIVESRNTIPILACVRIAATDTGLRISASNLNMWATASCPAAVAVAGETCVDAARLSAWLGTTPKGALVTAEWAPVASGTPGLNDGTLRFTAGRMQADIQTMDASMFPTHVLQDSGTEIPGALDAMAICLPLVDPGNYRLHASGVAISAGHAVAYDGHRVCAVDTGAGHDIGAIIPGDGIRAALAMGSARLWVSESSWRAESDGQNLAGKTIDAEFPQWSGLSEIPATATGETDADAFLDAIAAVMTASDGKTRAVLCEAKDGSLTLSCRGGVMSGQASVSWAGDDMTFGINALYAIDAAKPFEGGVLRIEKAGGVRFSCESKPGIRAMVSEMRV